MWHLTVMRDSRPQERGAGRSGRCPLGFWTKMGIFVGLCSISVINRWKRRCWGWFLASLSLVKGVLVSPSPAGRG